MTSLKVSVIRKPLKFLLVPEKVDFDCAEQKDVLKALSDMETVDHARAVQIDILLMIPKKLTLLVLHKTSSKLSVTPKLY